jgi:hypothetical protein
MRIPSLLLLALAAVSGCGITETGTCYDDRAYVMGTSIQEGITITDCEIAGTRRDIYRLTLDAPTTFKLSMVAPSVTTLLAITADDLPAGTADDNLVAIEGGVSTYTTHLSLPAGHYTMQLVPQSDVGGPYTLSSQALTPPLPAGCVETLTGRFIAMPGSRISGALTTTDCGGAQVDIFADRYRVRMLATKARTITVTSTVAGTIRILLDGVAQVSDVMAAGAAKTLTFTPTGTTYYVVEVASAGAGTYTLSID